jgi:hypothetical protein
MKNCAGGVSHFKGYWKDPLNMNNCNKATADLLDTLTHHQIKANPMRVYGYVTLLNLKKAFFKSSLYNKSGWISQISSFIFFLRSILLILGILGVLIIHKFEPLLKPLIYLIFLFMIFWYGYITIIYRDLEMRYFLQNDILMLIPASCFILFIYQKTIAKPHKIKTAIL